MDVSSPTAASPLQKLESELADRGFDDPYFYRIGSLSHADFDQESYEGPVGEAAIIVSVDKCRGWITTDDAGGVAEFSGPSNLNVAAVLGESSTGGYVVLKDPTAAAVRSDPDPPPSTHYAFILADGRLVTAGNSGDGPESEDLEKILNNADKFSQGQYEIDGKRISGLYKSASGSIEYDGTIDSSESFS